jgi:hypothetical protein
MRGRAFTVGTSRKLEGGGVDDAVEVECVD